MENWDKLNLEIDTVFDGMTPEKLNEWEANREKKRAERKDRMLNKASVSALSIKERYANIAKSKWFLDAYDNMGYLIMEIEIKTEKMSDIFTKQHILGLPFDAVIHHFTEIDSGDPHNHPFSFTSHILSGGYIERVYTIGSYGLWHYEDIERKPGTVHTIEANHIHQIISLPQGECYTLILPGPWEQKSGFYRFFEGGYQFRYWDEEYPE